MNCKKFLTCIVFSLAVFSYSQTAEMDLLLDQAIETVFTDPIESEEISEHVFWSTKSDDQKARALYLGALAFYVSGKYDDAIELAFRSKNLYESGNLISSVNDADLLIDRLLVRLQLNPMEREPGLLNIDRKTLPKGLIMEDLVKKGEDLVKRGKNDSLKFILNKADALLKNGAKGYPEIIYNLFKGDLAFKSNLQDSAYFYYVKGLEVESEVENPFLRKELYSKLSSNLFTLDSIEGFRVVNDLANELDDETAKIENNAANAADKLITENLDKLLDKKKKRYKFAFFGMVVLTASVILTKFLFTYRNKKQLNTYKRLNDYLSDAGRKELNSKVIEKDKTAIPTHRVSPILKDSENQILKDLAKFESSKKFRKKDMSLGMLASELNTNTKYLSEVINRYKNKNFNGYINQLRINYITDKIRSDSNYLNYKVSYLAEECGYSSHSTFTTVFKSVVGVTPIEFVNLVKNEHSIDNQTEV